MIKYVGGVLAVTIIVISLHQNLASETIIAAHPCDDDIYCHGSLLHTVQMAKLYKDSKTFVDKPLKKSRSEVHASFAKLMADTGNNPNKTQVQKFVDENFSPEGSEFEEWKPIDWNSTIPLFNKIKDPAYRKFAIDLHSRWKVLGRQIKKELALKPEQTSLIYMEKPFVVPGGRFREMYYWDSYWTIQGLLVSQMKDTVKGMLENFASLVQGYNLIPNGNRIYFTRRSQPPLFITMVDDYFKLTGDVDFLRKYLPTMDEEFNFWMTNRTTSIESGGKSYTLARYDVPADGPRPESYYEDYIHAQHFNTTEEKTEFYRNMKSGAESGWDYSTKWFVDKNGQDSEKLSDIKTRHIIPVELNAYLCRNAQIMEKFYKIVDDAANQEKYQNIGNNFQMAIYKVLWNNDQGAWFDYDTINKKQRLVFYPTNVSPLWAQCFPQSRIKEKSKKVISYMSKHKAFTYPGGVPTSMVKSGQQWDFSNAWAPLQEIIVTGLENTLDVQGENLALKVVEKWVKNNYVAFLQSNGKMFEKYDVEQIGLSGGGGEYDVVVGFGWSNGVLLHFLDKYGHVLKYDGNSGPTNHNFSMFNVIGGSVFSVLASLLMQRF